jgi:beta-fructofuranosidase
MVFTRDSWEGTRMTLAIEGTWIWDFWFAESDGTTHIFYLKSSANLPHERDRHWNVAIGHAVSTDRRTWTVLPDVLAPAAGEGWDDFTTWTGSVIRHEDRWYLFYTGTSRSESGLVQRIGAAVSDDLVTFVRHPANPLIEADPTWYERIDAGLWHDEAWRDPFVFRGTDGSFHAFITAREREGPADQRGVVGHARSEDLISWQVLPPVVRLGEFGHLELPHLRHIRDRWYVFFSVDGPSHARRRVARLDREDSGLYYVVGDTDLGPFEMRDHHTVVADEYGSLYGGRVFRDGAGWSMMAFENFRPDGTFVGTLTDPLPLDIEEGGVVTLAEVPTSR